MTPAAQTPIQAKHLVYMLGVSLLVIVFLVGWTLRENRQHQKDLAAAVVFRQKEVNQFLRFEVCERLEIRDSIQIQYLQAAIERYEKSDPEFANVLAGSARALLFTQEDRAANLPRVQTPGG